MISFCARRCFIRYSSIKLKNHINIIRYGQPYLFDFEDISTKKQKKNFSYRCFADDTKSKNLSSQPFVNDNFSELISSLKSEASLNHLVSMETLTKAVALIQHNAFNIDDSLHLIRCCGELMPNENAEAKIELARNIIKIAIENNIIDVQHYNAFLDILKENECNISAQEFLLSMMKHVSPNVTTYEKLLYCVCSAGDVSQSTSIITEMKKLNYPISEDVFNALVLGYGRAGDIANARAVFDTMLTTQIYPTEKTYSALLLGFAGSSEPYHILQTLREADSKQIKFETKSLFEVVYQLAMAGHDKYIPNILLGLSQIPTFTVIKAFCIRLIHKGAPKAAYTVLVELIKLEKTTDTEAYGSFLIKEMIYADTNVSTLIEICDSFMTSGKNMYALHTAYITAVKCGSSSALPLLNQMNEQGIEIRPHYFWPLIVSIGSHSGDSGVIGILRAMQNLKVTPDFETLRNYALPKLDMRNPVLVVRKLKDLRLTISEVLEPLICYLLNRNRLKDCVMLLASFEKNEINGDVIMNHLVKAVMKGANAKDIVVVLKSFKAVKNTKDDDESNSKMYSDWAGLLALEVITSDEKKKCFKKLHSLISCYKNEGLKLSSFATDIIADYYSKSNFKIDNLELLLNELRSSELTIPSSELFSQFIPHPRDMDLDELENHLLELKSKKMNTRGLLRRLLQGHCRKGNYTRALEVLAECENNRIIFSPGMLANVLDLYVKTRNIEGAEITFKNLRRQAPWFKLDEHKMIDYATFLIREGHLQGSIAVLKQYCLDHNVVGGEAISHNCFRLLSALSETGTPAQVREVLNELVDLRFCTKNNALLGPIIRAHLNKNDFEGAVYDFLTSVYENNCTPLQLELITHLAKRNETKLLNKVLDACKKVHGVVSTTAALAIAYATANKTTELRRLLTDPSSRISPIYLKKRCERLELEGNYQPMEVLAKVCKDLPQLVPENIYERILRIHCRNNNCEGVLELYNKILENDEKPSAEFLCTMINFLQSNKRPLPNSLLEYDKIEENKLQA